jgi:multidrug resistance efflux pump
MYESKHSEMTAEIMSLKAKITEFKGQETKIISQKSSSVNTQRELGQQKIYYESKIREIESRYQSMISSYKSQQVSSGGQSQSQQVSSGGQT